MRFATILLIAVLVTAPALAQQSPFSGPGASSAPIEISADLFEIDTNGREATFSGNVVITQSGFTLRSARVIVTYGEGGQTDLERVRSPGAARIEYGGQTARGDAADFDVAARVLTLSGNVEVRNSSGTFTGPLLTIDFVRGTTSFGGGTGGRVTGVFTPGG